MRRAVVEVAAGAGARGGGERQPAVSVRSQRSRDREAEQSKRSGSTVATHLAEMGEYAVLS